MKKYLLAFGFVVVGAGLLFTVWSRREPAPGLEETSPFVPSVQSVSDEVPSVSFSNPIRLRIPRIHVDARVEDVGLDEEKRMDVPKNDLNVGWYTYGPKPGEVGSSVLAGHYDAKDGGPAIFYRLNELSEGDTVFVTDFKGKERTFIVRQKNIYKDETFPIAKVFSQGDKPRLNLITCDGIFDPTAKNYSDRLVVFTELQTAD